ncbi:MAG: AMP-binding protein [Verrucomicrobiales bacterium]
MNLVQLLIDRARTHPEKVALVDGMPGRERVTSYRDLAALVTGASRRLRAEGLVPGDVVLILHPISLELYVFLLGAFHAGLTTAFVDPSAGGSVVATACQRLRPRAFFGSRKAQAWAWTRPEVRRLAHHWCPRSFPFTRSFPLDPAAPENAVVVPDRHPALVTFTSGSTGQPKGAARTHGFLLAQHAALERALGLHEGEVDLVTLPVFTLANLASGVASLLPGTDITRPAVVNAELLARQSRTHGVTRCAASPAVFRAFLKAGCLPDFRDIHTGGAPVFPSLLDELVKTSPKTTVHAVYGSTEAEPIADLLWRDISPAIRERIRQGSGLPAGKPVPEIELAILSLQEIDPATGWTDNLFSSRRLPTGQAGEIIVSGPHVLPGYLDGIGDAENKIHAGGKVWHRTGDAGRLDEEGNLWLLGRASAAVRRPGLPPLYPFEVEAALDGIPGLGRTALVEKDGEPALVFEGRTDLPPEAAGSILAGLGVRRVIPLPSLPMDRRHQAKIDYPKLQRLLE